MAEIAHSTPAPTIPLAGSSPPGGGKPVFRPASPSRPAPRPRPQTRPRNEAFVIDRLAAQYGPDAEVIDLAGRVAALAVRENRASGRVGSIEDHILTKGPQHPMREDPRTGGHGQVREMALPHLRFMLEREQQRNSDLDPDWVADVRQSIARMEEHEAAVRAMEERFGLARVEKRRRRMFLRLIRWAERLTAMEPATSAGVKAKAEAQLAVDRAGNFDNWTQELAASVGRDAIRVIEAEADQRFQADLARDGALFDLIARHGPALADYEAADEATAVPYAAWVDVANGRPAALYWRAGDRMRPATKELAPGGGRYRFLYVEADVERMRQGHAVSFVEHRSPAPWNVDEVVLRRESVPDPVGEARRIEIVAAWDGWQAAKAAVMESSGLAAANERCDALTDALCAIEDAVLAYQPRSFEGLQAKARWIASSTRVAQGAENLLRDVCRMPPVSASGLTVEHSSSPEEVARLDFEPWTDDCPVPTNSEWNEVGATYLPNLRLAWIMMLSSKEDLKDKFAGMLSEDSEAFDEVCSGLLSTECFLKDMHSLAAGAIARTLVTLRAMQFDDRYKHLVECGAATEARVA